MDTMDWRTPLTPNEGIWIKGLPSRQYDCLPSILIKITKHNKDTYFPNDQNLYYEEFKESLLFRNRDYILIFPFVT